jgi:hypothetical protein
VSAIRSCGERSANSRVQDCPGGRFTKASAGSLAVLHRGRSIGCVRRIRRSTNTNICDGTKYGVCASIIFSHSVERVWWQSTILHVRACARHATPGPSADRLPQSSWPNPSPAPRATETWRPRDEGPPRIQWGAVGGFARIDFKAFWSFSTAPLARSRIAFSCGSSAGVCASSVSVDARRGALKAM